MWPNFESQSLPLTTARSAVKAKSLKNITERTEHKNLTHFRLLSILLNTRKKKSALWRKGKSHFIFLKHASFTKTISPRSFRKSWKNVISVKQCDLKLHKAKKNSYSSEKSFSVVYSISMLDFRNVKHKCPEMSKQFSSIVSIRAKNSVVLNLRGNLCFSKVNRWGIFIMIVTI